MEAQVFTLASSPFVPFTIGFFCLGTGYLIRGGQACLVFLGGRLVGRFQFITGIWLTYCTYAMTVVLPLGAQASVGEGFSHYDDAAWHAQRLWICSRSPVRRAKPVDTGLETGEIIRAIDRTALQTASEFETLVRSLGSGLPVVLQVERKGKLQSLAFERE
jgi:hypothetical protein